MDSSLIIRCTRLSKFLELSRDKSQVIILRSVLKLSITMVEEINMT